MDEKTVMVECYKCGNSIGILGMSPLDGLCDDCRQKETDEIYKLKERIKQLEGALRNIINSLAIINNTDDEDIPVLIKRLKEYAEKALKGGD